MCGVRVCGGVNLVPEEFAFTLWIGRMQRKGGTSNSREDPNIGEFSTEGRLETPPRGRTMWGRKQIFSGNPSKYGVDKLLNLVRLRTSVLHCTISLLYNGCLPPTLCKGGSLGHLCDPNTEFEKKYMRDLEGKGHTRRRIPRQDKIGEPCNLP